MIPFHITISPRASNDAYSVHATTERGETWTELVLPEQLLASTDWLMQPGTLLPIRDPAALGRLLGRALFAPPLRDLLLRNIRAAAQAEQRLQIQLRITAPELAFLPWEWLMIGADAAWSPALRRDHTLVRVGHSARSGPPVALAGPLRVLAVAAAGEELQLEALEAALKPAMQAGRIDLRLLPDVTPDTLDAALAHSAVHVLHCAAPVRLLARGRPRLMIGRGIDSFDLLEMLVRLPRLRLVTLAGPQGDASTLSAAQPLLAMTLLGDALPATITFGGPLPALLAARFCAACYGRLARGAPADLAVTAGRQALAEHADGRGWGLAQLHIVPGGEKLFAIGGRAALSRRLALIPALIALLLVMLLVGKSLNARSEPATAQYRQQAAQFVERATPAAPTAPPPTEQPTPTVAPTAPPTPSSAAAPSLPQPPNGYATFLTGEGDTLESIASRMGSDAQAIAALNRLDAQEPLRPQRPLVIPVFRPGEGGAGGLVIPRGDPAKPQVALTFDIEIDDTTLYAILDVLNARGLHGTFFVTGRWVQRYPDAARAIITSGNEIGNHSLTHPYFSRIGLDGAASELDKTEQIVLETTGVSTHPYFRFPYGDFTAATSAIVAHAGYVAYHWSADDAAIPGWLAWAAQHPADAQGAILLMHGRPATAAALPGWLDQLATLGLQPTTLGDVLR
jgi:peptidoglycan/xylan/chitin deacetylase (PgdA/CDA1 family)